MLESLEEQKKIYDRIKSEYFFCSLEGNRIHRSNLRKRIWLPALKKAGLQFREMRQTRHSFATVALSCGESPLWIAKNLGHRNGEMIINVYSKFVEKIRGSKDGGTFNRMYQVTGSK